MIFDYVVKSDTLFLENKITEEKYRAYKVDLSCCTYRANHSLDGMEGEFYLPYFNDSTTIATEELKWSDSNFLIYEYLRGRNYHGTQSRINCDNISMDVKYLEEWYDYVTKTCNRIEVYADKRHSLIDMQMLILKLEALGCDSIYFAAIDDDYLGKIENVRWLNIKELSVLIPETEWLMYDKLKLRPLHRSKSENWLFDLITTANI